MSSGALSPRSGLLEAAEAVDAVLEFAVRAMKPLHEVSGTAASTLSTLASAGPQRLTELAVREGVRQPSMSTLVSQLEQRGLVERGADVCDGRVVLVAITAAGRALLARRRAARIAFLGSLVGELDEDGRRALVRAVPALRALVEARGVAAALEAAQCAAEIETPDDTVTGGSCRE